MVNTGKASNACAICKQRRIRCDLAQPACSQCIKSGWTCPGPKAEDEITIKDQTATVRRNAARRSSPTNTSRSSTPQSRAPSHSLVRAVSPSTSDRGTAFFMQQYIFLGNGSSAPGSGRGHHEYLPTLMRQESANGPLRTIIAAAGLAALSNAGNANMFATEAYQLYNEAIRQLRPALSNPEEACLDNSLAAMMLMGTFEAIASGDGDSMKFYRDHTMAVARCLDLRGPTQPLGSAPLKLFLELRRIILMTCHQLQTTVPHAIGHGSKWAEQLQSPSDLYSNQFAGINCQLAAIRAEIRVRGITSPAIISVRLLAIDQELLLWSRNLPASWSYSTYRTQGLVHAHAHVWQARYDAYTDLWVVVVWNSYRCVRLIIHEAIVKSILASRSTEHQDVLHASILTLREVVDDVCSSVPYLLGCNTASEDSVPQAMPGGYLLVWPLFLAGMMRTTPRAQRDWIAGVLKHIGLSMGLKLAMSMAGAMGDESRTLTDGESWLNGDFRP